jgi:AraC-like DNA-binding protein
MIREMISFELPGKILQPFVAYIYFLTENEPSKICHRMIFPNVGSALTIYTNLDFSEHSYQRFVAAEKKGENGIVLHINRADPIELTEIGRQNCITIVFKPLGINCFLRSSLRELQQDQNPTTLKFHGANKHFLDLVSAIAAISDKNIWKLIIENFLIENYHDFEYPILKKGIQELSAFENDENLSVTARRIGMSVKTMDRLFKEHVGLSPVEFRSISKFRASLKMRLASPADSLNKVAIQSNYSDLPYMMKVYKKFTRRSAKSFFDSISTGADGQYVYHEYY